MPKAMTDKDGLLDSWGRKNRTLEDKNCAACNAVFRPKKSSSKFCSRPCMWSKNGGKNKKPISWWVNQKGYIEGRIWISDSVQIRLKQHRWVVEGILGRPLQDDEDVHHKNGDKSDNSPENLEVLFHGEHTRQHNLEREYKRGYKLNLTQEQREERSLRAMHMQLSKLGKAAKAIGAA